METDVVIIGYGGAGAVASVAAHDAGAKVLIVESSSHGGGNTLLSMGGFLALCTGVVRVISVSCSFMLGRRLVFCARCPKSLQILQCHARLVMDVFNVGELPILLGRMTEFPVDVTGISVLHERGDICWVGDSPLPESTVKVTRSNEFDFTIGCPSEFAIAVGVNLEIAGFPRHLLCVFRGLAERVGFNIDVHTPFESRRPDLLDHPQHFLIGRDHIGAVILQRKHDTKVFGHFG